MKRSHAFLPLSLPNFNRFNMKTTLTQKRAVKGRAVMKFYQVYNVYTFTCQFWINLRAMFVQAHNVVLHRMFSDIETYSGEFASRGDLAGIELQVIQICKLVCKICNIPTNMV